MGKEYLANPWSVHPYYYASRSQVNLEIWSRIMLLLVGEKANTAAACHLLIIIDCTGFLSAGACVRFKDRSTEE